VASFTDAEIVAAVAEAPHDRKPRAMLEAKGENLERENNVLNRFMGRIYRLVAKRYGIAED
jgi:hypothetical protein